MDLKEAKDIYKNEFTTFEVYRFTGRRHAIHTDYVEETEDYNDESEVIAHQLMDEDDYNSTIFANCSNKFANIYGNNDKVLVLVIK